MTKERNEVEQVSGSFDVGKLNGDKAIATISVAGKVIGEVSEGTMFKVRNDLDMIASRAAGKSPRFGRDEKGNFHYDWLAEEMKDKDGDLPYFIALEAEYRMNAFDATVCKHFDREKGEYLPITSYERKMINTFASKIHQATREAVAEHRVELGPLAKSFQSLGRYNHLGIEKLYQAYKASSQYQDFLGKYINEPAQAVERNLVATPKFRI